MSHLKVLFLLAVTLTASLSSAQISDAGLVEAVDASELSHTFGLTLVESRELAHSTDLIKFWAIFEASDCFNTTEIVYNKSIKEIVKPFNGFSFSDPVQRDGVTPCNGGN